jgi:hypothetical protein
VDLSVHVQFYPPLCAGRDISIDPAAQNQLITRVSCAGKLTGSGWLVHAHARKASPLITAHRQILQASQLKRRLKVEWCEAQRHMGRSAERIEINTRQS